MIKVKIYDGNKFVRTIKGDMFVGVVGTECDDGYESQIAINGWVSEMGAIGMMGALADAAKCAARDMAETSEQLTERMLMGVHLMDIAGCGPDQEEEDE